MRHKTTKRAINYLEMSGFLEELAALRKVAVAARLVVVDCKGTGIRYPNLIKAIEYLDETLEEVI